MGAHLVDPMALWNNPSGGGSHKVRKTRAALGMGGYGQPKVAQFSCSPRSTASRYFGYRGIIDVGIH